MGRAVRWMALAGIAFLACMAGNIFAVGHLDPGGGSDDPPQSAQVQAALQERGWAAGLGGVLLALAGLAWWMFVLAIDRLVADSDHTGIGRWARGAALAWTVVWLVAGAFSFAAIDMANHFDHPSGAHTMLLASYLVYANPLSILLGGCAILAIGLAIRAARRLPAWTGTFSIACAILSLVGVAAFATGIIGMLGNVGVVVWMLVMSVVVPWKAWRAQERPDVPEGPSPTAA